jgi:hypothetical protein
VYVHFIGTSQIIIIKKKEKTERTKKEILIYLKNINIKILKQLEKNCNESLSQLYLRINDLRVKK